MWSVAGAKEIAHVSRKITAASNVPAEQLRVFQAGTLLGEHIAEVAAHLQIRAACCNVLSGLPEDNFFLRVRYASENPSALLQQGSSSMPPPRIRLPCPK